MSQDLLLQRLRREAGREAGPGDAEPVTPPGQLDVQIKPSPDDDDYYYYYYYEEYEGSGTTEPPSDEDNAIKEFAEKIGDKMHGRSVVKSPTSSLREYVFYVFFRFQKNMTFTFFLKWRFKKKRKSHKKYSVCWMSVEILASKLPDVKGTYRHLAYHIQFSVA